ncbi:hypothetical protein DE146DRAFT_787229 [Phaeosphaeria sp. MPI-PUGE-AT-0046c]|nr:hypothetical protein DE146DRAFT_787229 [Phaeosphaeria sp. MPI-PUGE-AT-0046c]
MINDIFGCLRPHDLTKLAQCSTKWRDMAQSLLWQSVELHRQDAHHEPYGLSTQQHIHRSYLDEELREPRSYRASGFWDFDFEKRNAKFGTAIRQLFRTAGKSKAWTRLAPVVHHVCITVTNKSPNCIWDMILSLPNLTSVEIIGGCSLEHDTPPRPASLRIPNATKIRSIRLRGYIPANFVEAMCMASAATIVSLDLAALEPRKEISNNAEEIQALKDMNGFLYAAPQGILWLKQPATSLFTSLTHLLLCKNGNFDGHVDRYAGGDMELDEEHDSSELQQWAVLLRGVRATLVEVLVEQRPVHSVEILSGGVGFSVNDENRYCPNCTHFDDRFCNKILNETFGDGKVWPKLKRLTLRGLNLQEYESDHGEELSEFTQRVLPGVEVIEESGHYMFFNPYSGTIENLNGADGLKPQLDAPWLM